MPGKTFLKAGDVNLRTIEEEDINFLTTINNPEIWKNLSSVSKPQNKKQQEEFFEKSVCDNKEVHLSISYEEEMKGIISLIPTGDEGTAKIGLWIAEEYQGKGYGTKASKRLTSYAFKELRFHKVMARAVKSNKGSNRIWEKLGFEKEGKLREQIFREGRYEDVNTYGVLKGEWINEHNS